MELDHEKLDVYRVALDFAAWAYALCRTLKGTDRPARDQLLRASQSIALNIAEGCGKVPSADRGRFFQIAGGSARECGAILDILDRCGVLDGEATRKGKELLVRIVAMLTRMIERGSQVREDDAVYGNVNVNENGNVYGKERGGVVSAAVRAMSRSRSQRSGTRSRTRG
jgi:four helix bundle protein